MFGSICSSLFLFLPSLLFHFQSVFEFVRLNSRLKSTEMCGVFMGSSCALRVSDKLNWTINIPDRKDKKKMSDHHEHHGEDNSSSGIPVISMKDLLSLHDFADYPQRGPDDNIDRFHHHNTSYHLPHLEDNILPTHDQRQQSLEEPFDPNFVEDHHDTHWTRRKKSIRKKRSATSRPGLETFKVLQLTDLHFDPYFVSTKDFREKRHKSLE